MSEPITINSPVVPTASRDGDTLAVTVKGDVDVKNSPELRRVLLELIKPEAGGMPKRLEFNLSHVTYMDSSAIAVLVEMLQKARPVGGIVALTHVQPRVRGLLEIARLDTIFKIVKD